ncbi:MAG: GNAT family N-acetyltransferase [Anaerolineae bacterium]|nr:GNAT family N-acetyltransferase [Anaerolineae bacterium]
MKLETERLILREFQEHDWPAILAYQSDPRYLRYYEWTDRTPEAAQAFVRMFLAQQQAQPRIKFQLAVTLRANGQLIGNCGIRLDSIEAHEGDIGYELDPGHWGRGYATEAARAVVQFGFDELKLHRIWSWCVADNAGSARVLTKLGMRQEGRLRDKDYYKGRWWDRLLFAILEDEWHERQALDASKERIV